MTWTRKRVGILTMSVWVVWLAVAFALPISAYNQFLGPPLTISANNAPSLPDHLSLKIDDQPAVNYRANFTLSTVRAFAVGNYIHIKAVIYDVNLTDFGSHFQALGFLHAGYPQASGVMPVLPKLKPMGSGIWTAEGDFVFLTLPNATGPMLIPSYVQGATVVNIPDLYTYSVVNQIEGYNFPLCGTMNANSAFCAYTIQSQAITLQITSDETTIRNEVALASLSAFGLLFVFDYLLIPERDKRQTRKRKKKPAQDAIRSEDGGELTSTLLICLALLSIVYC